MDVCSHGIVADVQPTELTIRCQEDPTTYVRIYDPYVIDSDGTAFSIEAHADGLHAHISPIEVWVGYDTGLATFLAGLAEDFRGWDGERAWHTNHLTVRAVHHSRGHVALTWTLRHRLTRAGSWRVSLTMWQEAGAQMSRLADEMHGLLPEAALGGSVSAAPSTPRRANRPGRGT